MYGNAKEAPHVRSLYYGASPFKHYYECYIDWRFLAEFNFRIYYHFHGETNSKFHMGLVTCIISPLIGFILYLLLGRQIQRDQIFKLNKDKIGLEMIVDEQLEALKNKISLKATIKLLNSKKWFKCCYITTQPF